MGNRIREHRKKLGWSQEVLAEKVGTTYQQISRLERDERGLDTEWIGKIAVALGVPQAMLLDDPDALPSQLSWENVAPGARDIWRAIGKRMRFVRLARMLRDLPEVAAEEMGWTLDDLAEYEAGTKPLPIEDLISFILRFSVSPEFLLLEKVDRLDEPLRERWGK